VIFLCSPRVCCAEESAVEEWLHVRKMTGYQHSVPRDAVHYLCAVAFNVLYLLFAYWYDT